MRICMMQRTMIRATGAVLLFVLGACASLPQHQVADLKDLPAHRVLVVGKIELHPPLQPGEQSILSDKSADMKNTFVLLAGDELSQSADQAASGVAGLYETKFDAEFYIAIEKIETLFLHGGTYYTVYGPPAQVEAHFFDSPLKVDLRPDDRAVYVGTLQYHRGFDHSLKAVMVRDDYAWADTQFKDRFGTSMTLRKALAVPAPAAPR